MYLACAELLDYWPIGLLELWLAGTPSVIGPIHQTVQVNPDDDIQQRIT